MFIPCHTENIMLITLRDKNFYSLENYDGEIWLDLVGFEGIYKISNYGRIKRLQREWRSGRNGSQRKSLSESIVKQRRLKSGYVKTTLCKDGVKKSYSVHILVAKTFIPNPENKPQVNHKDMNKENNMVENLEWNTAKENVAHCRKNKYIDNHAKTRNKKIDKSLALTIREYYNTHKNKSHREISKEFNVSYYTVKNIISGRFYK